ncbi:hypothetical protein OKW41_004599 [Paraburkholderia sp. UCT70]
MAASNRITMTMRELDRFKVIQDVADGKLKPWRAAERLRLTTRQVRRLVGRLREHGPEGLVTRRRAKPSNNRLDSTARGCSGLPLAPRHARTEGACMKSMRSSSGASPQAAR